jgi:DNA repair photolyase
MPRQRPRQHGRAAGYNPDNRFVERKTVAIDDGWEPVEHRRLRTRVIVDHARKAISYNDSLDIPFDRSINPYRGCEHGCIYCYARPTHAWLDLSPGLDFESRLFVRHGISDLLRKELAEPGYEPAPIAISGITDPYQPIEREQRITRSVLEVLAETRHPVLLITKSSLVERDIDLLSEMTRFGLVEVAVSLTTMDRELCRVMEPRAASPRRRLQTIAALADAGIPVRAMIAPVVPVLTEPEIEQLLTAARDAGARHAGYVLLRLPLEVSPLFRDWLADHYPDAASRILKHVRDCRGGRDNDSRFGRRLRGTGPYADLIAQRFELASRRLGFTPAPSLRRDLFSAPRTPGQLDLFFDADP